MSYINHFYIFLNMNNNNNNNNNNKAFSLIELSIVLIIIGLLVAGITGGASLIHIAKVKSTITELKKYNIAFNTFKVANDRLPGDVNNDGFIGWATTSKINGKRNVEPSYSNFGGDYKGISVGYRAGPWVEL